MKRRLFRTTAAALLAIAVMLPGGARPAAAVSPVVIAGYVRIAVEAYTTIRDFLRPGASQDDLQRAVRQIIAAIESSKTEILNRIDAIATADASACARQSVVEFADIELFTPQTMQRWAQDATGCVTRIQSLIGVVGDKAQTDLLGLALNTAGPIAIAARARAGFSTDALRGIVAQGNRSLVTLLEPACTFTPLWGDQPPGSREVEVVVRCAAYPGAGALDYVIVPARRGQPLVVPLSAYAHVVEAASNQTSRAVAIAALGVMPA
ncbi:hypothetical protein [Virgisporangium aurantiacum]|uniref:Uncharacterized protein n=1 Tax=Virgisporangium aurantiacum TaxID=175570 RepID=A0A8J3Z7Z8_9ACTN|nr:hypothetical protein [Virgisporangium aurantiacum]GIJ56630.1 hypothetical protein Vau01_041460 [Virgisporangium aurantiacum]